jgi:ABC-type transport system substrate-binding protein
MRKLPLLLSSIVLLLPLITGFACQSNVATTETKAVASAQALQPVYGGTLRMVTGYGPYMLGYPPMMDPIALMAVLPGAEKLLDISADPDQQNGWEPVLAESYEDDIANKRIVFHLRPGIRFHDGSPLDADTVIWNYDQLLDAGRLQYPEHWQGTKKIDDLTFEIDYTEYSNQLLRAWTLFPVFSREAWETASGGDLQKGIDWARTHCVGTGPFILKEYIRDSHLIWEKHPDYWKEDRPYLDSIEVRIIPDSQTSRMILEAGQADFWQLGYQRDMADVGFHLQSGPQGLIYSVWPNTSNPGSRWNDIRLRQALDYAIDKQAIAAAFGSELFTALTMLAPPGVWGYDPDYPARLYDPEKARQLVTDAGYPDGLDAQMILDSSHESVDLATAIKGYLDDAGIRTELDVADPGRFGAAVYQTAGTDLSLFPFGSETNYLVSYMNQLSSYSIAPMAYLGQPAEAAPAG